MSPEQLERRRASRERWRERHRDQEAERIRHRSGSPGRTSGSPAPDTPDTPPDQAVDAEVLALRAQVAALLANQTRLEAELAELRRYRQQDIERSRRTRERRRDRAQRPVATGQRPDATGTPPLARDVQSGPPPEYESYPGVSLAAVAVTTRARGAAAAAAAAAADPAPSVDPWTEPAVLELLEAKNLRPLPMRALMARLIGQAPTADLGAVLKFVNRQYPAPAANELPRSGVRRAGPSGLPDTPDASLAWIDDVQAACEAEQNRMLAAAGVVL